MALEELRVGVESAGQRQVKRYSGQYQVQSGRQNVPLQLLFSCGGGQNIEVLRFADLFSESEVPIPQFLRCLPGQIILLLETLDLLTLIVFQSQSVLDFAERHQHGLTVIRDELLQNGFGAFNLSLTLAAVEDRREDLTGDHKDPVLEQVR